MFKVIGSVSEVLGRRSGRDEARRVVEMVRIVWRVRMAVPTSASGKQKRMSAMREWGRCKATVMKQTNSDGEDGGE
jgi:hypothetical protein